MVLEGKINDVLSMFVYWAGIIPKNMTNHTLHICIMYECTYIHSFASYTSTYSAFQ